MALTIPNEGAAPADPQQSTLYQADIDAIVAGIGGDGVVSGCAVTAQGSPDDTVAVAAGSVLIGGALVTVASGNVTMPTADSTHPMWVLISVSNAGTKTATAGTAAASPLLPAIPANHVALAAVWWPASDTTVATAQITDKRAVLKASVAFPQILDYTTPGTYTPDVPTGATRVRVIGAGGGGGGGSGRRGSSADNCGGGGGGSAGAHGRAQLGRVAGRLDPRHGLPRPGVGDHGRSDEHDHGQHPMSAWPHIWIPRPPAPPSRLYRPWRGPLRIPAPCPGPPRLAAITVVDSATATGSGTSATGTLPSYVAGDVLVATVTSPGAAPTGGDIPSGWTYSTDAKNNTWSIGLYYKAAGSESAPTWTTTTGAWTVIIVAYRGVDTTTPVRVSGRDQSGFSQTGTTVTLNSLVAGDLYVLAGFAQTQGSYNATVAGNSPRHTVSNTSTSIYYDELLASGGNTSRSISWSGFTYDNGVGLALIPAAATGSLPTERRRTPLAILAR